MSQKTLQYFSRFIKCAALAAATGFGLGYSPFASGTAGALLGIPLMLGLSKVWTWGIIPQSICCLVLTACAIPVCDAAEKFFQKKDDRRIVADEYLTFPIGLIGLPLCLPAFLLAFVTNRALDIIKPFPAGRAQRLTGGLGIVADDAISALYSLALNHILFPVLMKHIGFE